MKYVTRVEDKAYTIEIREEQIADARIIFGTTRKHIVSGQKGMQGAFKSQEIMDLLKQSIQIASDLREELFKQVGINP